MEKLVPTYVDESIEPATTMSFTDGVVNSTTVGTRSFTRESRTYPPTVQRKLPADLFANGTSRTTSSVLQNMNRIRIGYRSTSRDTTITWGALPTTFWSTSHGTDPTLPALDWEPIFNKIRGDIRGNGVNLAMALAEYRQTASLFASGARLVASRGKSLAAAVRARSGVSKTWLGFQYGVKPVTSDILGALHELQNAAKHPVYILGVESRKQRNVAWSDIRNISTFYDVSGTCESHAQRRMRCRWRAEYRPNEVFNTLAAHGFTNPFALAYELVPYSFVLDWWINVGDVLASLDNLLMFSKLEVITSESRVNARYITSPGFSRQSGANFVEPHFWTRISRTDTRSSPRAISMIQTLKYKPSVSLTHVLNGLALLRVARGRF